MMVSSVTKAAGMTGITGESAAQLGSDFMTLLVAQLKTQDPLDPLDGSEFMSQLVQLQSLAELTRIRSSLSEISGLQTLGPALGLVGRTVEWLDAQTGERLAGVVSGLEAQSEGACALVVGDACVGLAQVLAIR